MAKVNIDTATRLDIECRRNDTFRLKIDFGVEMPDASSNTYTFRFATSDTATPDAGSSNFTVAESNNSDGVTNALLTLTCTAGNMTMSPGLYVYDLAVTDTEGTRYESGDVQTLLFGTLKVIDDLGA